MFETTNNCLFEGALITGISCYYSYRGIRGDDLDLELSLAILSYT